MDLLAPAGNYQKFIAGLLAGADAFYLGLVKFSARSSAGNFSLADLRKVFIAANLHNKKIYLAINTLIHESELSAVIDAIGEIAHYNPAGIILQDLALIKIVKTYFPHIPLVASTQMSVHNLAGVQFLEDAGFDQVVLARELSMEEITYIKQNSKIKLEIFLHGAMCFSYSGQCLFSSFIGGRSGNRGQCAQVCRKKFILDEENSGCLLSPKDLDGTNSIHKLAEIGVSSLKIEGRMRSPQYTYAAVRYYRALLDELPADEIQKRRASLQIAFDRGSSDGYFGGKNDDLVDKDTAANHGLHLGNIRSITPNCAIIQKIADYTLKKGDGIAVRTHGRSFGFVLNEEPINSSSDVSVLEQLGQFKRDSEIFVTSEYELAFLNAELPKIPLNISLKSDHNLLVVKLDQMNKQFELPLEPAKSEQDFNVFLTKKISNFDHSVFKLIPIEIIVAPGLFMPYSLLRDSLKTLLDNFVTDFATSETGKITIPTTKTAKTKTDEVPKPIFIVDNLEQLLLCKKLKIEICLSYDFYKSCTDKSVVNDQQYRLLLPPFIKDKFYQEIIDLPDNILPVVSNLGEVHYFAQKNIQVETSWHLNLVNSLAADQLFEHGVNESMLSLEENLSEIAFEADRNYSLLVFGNFPVMTTEYCIVKNNGSCLDCKNKHQLVDEKKAEYILRTNSFCQNEIYFHTPLFLADDYNKLLKYPLKHWFVNLAGYSNDECSSILDYFLDGVRSENFKNNIADLKQKKHLGRYIF